MGYWAICWYLKMDVYFKLTQYVIVVSYVRGWLILLVSLRALESGWDAVVVKKVPLLGGTHGLGGYGQSPT